MQKELIEQAANKKVYLASELSNNKDMGWGEIYKMKYIVGFIYIYIYIPTQHWICIFGLYEGNPSVAGVFPAQMVSNAKRIQFHDIINRSVISTYRQTSNSVISIYRQTSNLRAS